MSQNLRSLLLLFLLLAALWFVFAPVQLGGAVSYVIVNGNSMAPRFQLGDLILARRQPQYQVGDRVVYAHPDLGHVFHRIIDQDESGFILQGDNNDWIDGYHPSPDEIVGRFWIHIPGGGKKIESLRKPGNFALIAGIMGLMLGSIFLFDQDSGQRKGRKKRMNDRRETSTPNMDTRLESLILLGILALAALVLGIFAFTRPLTKMEDANILYEHQGEFSYSAQDTEDVYDSEEIRTGEPVFLNLTCDVDVQFDYQLSSQALQPADAGAYQGSYQILARVSHENGWNRTLPLTDGTPFSGTSFSSDTALDLCRVHELISNMEEKTGTTNRWYELTVLPQVSVSGTLDGQALEDEYQPKIVFQLDSNLMRLPQDTETLVPPQTGEIARTQSVKNSLSIFGRDLPVHIARWLAGGLLGAALTASLWPLRSLYQDWKESDVSRIQVQYHPMLVDVKQGSLTISGSQIVEVSSFQDLTKMAERYGAMILHEERGDVHLYSVQDEQTVYQYALDTSKEKSLFPSMGEFTRSINRAIQEEELELYYQPVVALSGQKIVGIEAFIRWKHPKFGVIYPAEFISMAEQSGVIPHIDHWVIGKACRQLREWHDFGMPLVPLSINISPETLREEDFVETVIEQVKRIGVDPRFLQLEINRSNQVIHNPKIKDHLQKLRYFGIRLALDNFATDAANQINQISRIPINSLKIDRSIMQQMLQDVDNVRLVSAVVKMAKSLEIEVIAQGVETQEQITLLEEQEIEFAQGFLLGDPIQAKDMGWLLGKKADIEGEFIEE